MSDTRKSVRENINLILIEYSRYKTTKFFNNFVPGQFTDVLRVKSTLMTILLAHAEMIAADDRGSFSVSVHDPSIKFIVVTRYCHKNVFIRHIPIQC